jgi:hypothetical protein
MASNRAEAWTIWLWVKIRVLAATVITRYKIYEIPLPMDAYMPAAGPAGLSPKISCPYSPKITGCPKVVD